MGVPQPYALFVPCSPGLEPWLLAEARALGGVRPRPVPGGVELEANDHVLFRCLMELGLALDVRARLGSFPARNLDGIVRDTAALAWTRFIGAGQSVEIRASARRSRILHTGAIEERVLRGIRSAVGSLATAEIAVLPHLDEESPEGDGPPLGATDALSPGGGGGPWRVFARMENDRLTLSISVAGLPLHRRGYRLATGKAPLREDLARALLVLAGWDPSTPLVDPFCGAGTIVIEAARMARRIPPGWARSFHLERSPTFDRDRFERLRARLGAAILPKAPAPILGSDRDPGAVLAAESNAERAGVVGDLELKVAPLGAAPGLERPPREAGLWASNPPFGDRTARGEGLRALFQTIGSRFRGLPEGWRIALLVDSPKLAWSTGLALEGRGLLDHGGKKVRLYVGPAQGGAG